MPKTLKQDREQRLAKLADLLAGGCYNWEEIQELLPEYHYLVRRSIERDMETLLRRGYVLIAERHHGSRWVSHRLEKAPGRVTPKLEKKRIMEADTQLKPKSNLAELLDTVLLNTNEAGEWLGMTRRRINYLCKAGRIASQLVGKQRVIKGKDLKAYVSSFPTTNS